MEKGEIKYTCRSAKGKKSSLLGLFEPLGLEHKSLVEKYVRKYLPSISELTFVNMWVWCMCHPVWLHEEDNTLYMLRKGEKDFYGFMPVGAKKAEEKANRLMALMREFGIDPRMERVAELDAMELKNAGYNVSEDRGNYDYVYLKDDLAELKGRKYHSKRNHISNCLKNYKCEYVPLTMDMMPGCHGFLEEWCKMKNCAQNPDLCCEHRAIRFMLYDYDKFDVIGGIIKVNGEVAAVTFGEKLNNDTAVIHFEKAHPEIRGLYPLINQWFCKYALKEFTWVNREQDLGSPGLRKAKKSYYPEKMVKKFKVTPCSV